MTENRPIIRISNDVRHRRFTGNGFPAFFKNCQNQNKRKKPKGLARFDGLAALDRVFLWNLANDCDDFIFDTVGRILVDQRKPNREGI